MTDRPGLLARGFDPPEQPWLAGHRGVDLIGTAGDPVRSPIAGRVVVAERIVDRGVLVIERGRQRVSLEPVQPRVQVGDRVAVGDPVGVLEPGHRGCPAPHCLHWGLRVAGEYRDPLLLVREHRPVLLPS